MGVSYPVNFEYLSQQAADKLFLSLGFSLKEGTSFDFLNRIISIGKTKTIKDMQSEGMLIEDLFDKKFKKIRTKYFYFSNSDFCFTKELMESEEVKEAFLLFKREEVVLSVKEFQELQRYFICFAILNAREYDYEDRHLMLFLLRKQYPKILTRASSTIIIQTKKHIEMTKKMMLMKNDGKLSYQAREFVYAEIIEFLGMEENEFPIKLNIYPSDSFLRKILNAKKDLNEYVLSLEKVVQRYLEE